MSDIDPIKAIFADARALHAAAMDMLHQGKIRNAAEKAWGATKRATDALILARTGELPATTALTSQGLRSLGRENAAIAPLVGRYYTRIGQLHGECFYNGMCDPLDDTERRIRETDDYIRDAEQQAGL